MGNVTVTLLGGFAAAVDGEPVPEAAWRLKKARELVKLLALAPGHRLHREQAMDVLWRDRAPAAAANNLHQAVHVARRALDPDAIEVRDEVLSLGADVDVDRFELAAARCAPRRDARPPTARRSRSTAASCCPRTATTTGRTSRRDELAELAAELADELAALGPGRRGPRGLPADASSFIGRGRELAELRPLLGRTRLLTLAGTGGAGKTRLALELARAAETSRTPAARRSSSWPRSPTRGSSRTRSRPRSTCARCPARTSSTRVVDFLAPRTLLLVARQLRAPARRRLPRSPTRCCARRPS